ncbi:MAG: hypothetical protein ABI867_02640 [Kofleriaceae bacterium]
MRALIYLVERERDPLENVDRVLADVVFTQTEGGTPTEYCEALDRALASNVALARLGPEYHPEPIVRRFLSEIRRRLTNIN